MNRIVAAEVLILLYLVKYIIAAIIGLLYGLIEVHSDNLRIVRAVNRELTKSSAYIKEGLVAIIKIRKLIKQFLIAIIISYSQMYIKIQSIFQENPLAYLIFEFNKRSHLTGEKVEVDSL